MRADLVAAYRSLTASKTFTVVAVTVLALGIGVTTAIYSVVDATLLRRLPYRDADRLVEVREHHTELPPDEYLPVAPQNYLDWAANQEVFDALAAVAVGRATVVEPGAEAEDWQLDRVSADFFAALSFTPIHGRTFVEDEEVEGRHRVIVLSHALWQRRYGGDAAVIGRQVPLDGESFEIIGVLGEDSVYPPGSLQATDAFVPLVFSPDEAVRRPNVRASYLTVIGKLREGTALAQAQAGMGQIARTLQLAHPAWNGTTEVRVRPLIDLLVGAGWRQWLWLLMGASGAVLLIACVNVAMLQLARGASREHEMSVRLSLGGGRWRLIRQLLVENVALALLAAVAAAVVAMWGVAVFKAGLPNGMPRIGEIHVDRRVLLVMTMVAGVVGIAVGLAPGLHASSARPWGTLATVSRTLAGRPSRHLGRTLVAVESAAAVTLLAVTVLLVRSFVAAISVDLGFDVSRVLLISVTSPTASAGPRSVRTASAPPAVWNDAAVRALVQRLREAPGVTHAAFAKVGMPFGPATFMNEISVQGQIRPGDPSALVRRVSPEYHETLRIPLRVGRLLSNADRDGTPAVAVINEHAVRVFFDGRSPLGQTVVVGGLEHTVVGVVGDARHHPEADVVPEFAVPLWAGGGRLRGISGELAVRTVADPYELLPAVRRAVTEVFPELVVREVTTMEVKAARGTAWRRFNSTLMSVFGVLGLTIAAVGVYGTLAFGVERRTREIGVRMALGAAPQAVIRLAFGEAGIAVSVGILIGTLATWSLSSVVRGHLFNVEPRDTVSLATGCLLVALTTVVASLMPVRRALRVNPAESLRAE